MTYQSLSPFDGKLIKGFDDINGKRSFSPTFSARV